MPIELLLCGIPVILALLWRTGYDAGARTVKPERLVSIDLDLKALTESELLQARDYSLGGRARAVRRIFTHEELDKFFSAVIALSGFSGEPNPTYHDERPPFDLGTDQPKALDYFLRDDLSVRYKQRYRLIRRG